MESRTVISNLEKLLTQGKESALLRFSLANEYLKLREIWVAVFHLKRALASGSRATPWPGSCWAWRWPTAEF